MFEYLFAKVEEVLTESQSLAEAAPPQIIGQELRSPWHHVSVMSVSQDSDRYLQSILRTQKGTIDLAQVETSREGVVVISSGLSHESSKDQHSG
jgi:hypothetical protein